MIKKSVLFISFAYIVYSIILVLVSINCQSHTDWCNIREDDPFGRVIFVFMPLFPVFLLSLLTYKMKDEVFQAWFRFSLWFVPIIIVFQYIFMNSGGGGYIGNNDFAIFFTSIFYIIFILVSLIKIIRAYKRTKA
ncbi:MAG: hypothetical protein HYV45_02545 [Candidatus Moranbacteria bacterium]|nr:hypothetical protein [Candidatus Moranbacteria bacterium]